MPKKSSSRARKKTPPLDVASDLEYPPSPDIRARQDIKQSGHAAVDNEELEEEGTFEYEHELTKDESAPSIQPKSILTQLPRVFKKPPEPSLLDDVDDEQPGKVLDQHTPPTEAWAQTVPFGKSPPTGPWRGLAESPPVQPSPLGRGGFNTRSPPVSPAQRKARPVSYGSAMPPPPIPRRSSGSPYGFSPGTYGSPLPPHMPQQHFYAAQDVDLRLKPSAVPEAEIELTRFLSVPRGLTHAAVAARCYVGSVEILGNNQSKWEVIGAIHGLSGTVVDAQLLEWDTGHDPFSEFRPLLAVVIHGPTSDDVEHHERDRSEDRQSSAASRVRSRALGTGDYQTRVEVYSLSTQQLIRTLMFTPKAPSIPTFRGQPSKPPEPIGNLKLQSSGKYLTVSSGVSGEVFVFGVTASRDPRFVCMGKFWTSLQPHWERRESSHARASDAQSVSHDRKKARADSVAPIIDLKGRWLAFSPPQTVTQPTVGCYLAADIDVCDTFSVDSTSAQIRPAPNCEVDSPDADTVMSSLARGVAQGVVKGASWLGEQANQAWQNYWSRDQGNSSVDSRRTSSPTKFSGSPNNLYFPPTHADEGQPASRELQLVSIIDLRVLQPLRRKSSAEILHKFITFAPPRGCSFVSFSPTGLRLLTAGRKGDVEYVWDLMQIKHCRSRLVLGEDAPRSTPCIRQIARFDRLSPSTILEAIWEAPLGDRFALVTKNRTVHMFDLPTMAARWPPARSSRRDRPISAPANPGSSSEQQETNVGGWYASAMNLAGKSQPMLASLRGRAPSMSGGLAGIGTAGIGLASATGVAGTRAVAAGLSRSMGAATETVSTIRHAHESRIHLKNLVYDEMMGRLAWLRHGRRTALLVLETGCAKAYYVRKTKVKPGQKQQSVSVFEARRAVNTVLPKVLVGDQVTTARGQEELLATESELTGFWRELSLTDNSEQPLYPLAFAEIETNAPYQPFHSDQRVNLFIYSDMNTMDESQLPTASMISAPLQCKHDLGNADQWVFGEDIPVTRLLTASPHESEFHAQGYSEVYRETRIQTTADDMDQIVSTTKRRKKKTPNNLSDSIEHPDEEGFFEDDCDVLDFAEDRV